MRARTLVPAAVLVLAACAETSVARDDLREAFEPTLPARAVGSELPFTGRLPGPPRSAAPEPPRVEPAPPPPPPTPIGDDTRYALDLRGVPVAEAVHLIAGKAGVNVYLDAGLDMPVDASFPAVTLDQALDVILTRHQLRLVEEPPGVYWVERRDGTQTETRMIRLRSIHAVDVAANLESLVGGRVDLVVDASQNLILMRGPGEALELASAYLEEADRLRPQVLIEVEILEVALEDRFELGIQTALADDHVLGDLAASIDVDLSTGADQFTAVFSHATESISAVVNALSHFGAVNVVSSPRVLAVTNTEANIEVVTEVPYVDTSTSVQTDSGGAGVTSQETVAFKEVGIKLKVTPIVQEGGVVSLLVDQEFSEVVDFFLGVPVVDSRRVQTSFLVAESDTAMIGGLIQDRRSETDRGVPVLMHIPLIGRLFRSDEDSVARRELIVLLRPRLADPAQAARLAAEYHDEYVRRLRASGLPDERAEAPGQ
jgi:type II secretory pathway component GspD/PulD (secretin)